MLLIDIIPPGRDKRSFLQMLYDPGNLILHVFAGCHAVTHARESQEQKGIPSIGQYIYGNNISTIVDKKFWGRSGKKLHGKMKYFQGLP